jgi:hypothetical protein
MTPTHVFGYGAREYRDAHGWTNALVVEGSSLNPKVGASGLTPDKERVIFITPGTYDGVSGFLGKRGYVSVIGDPAERAHLRDSGIALQDGVKLAVHGLELQDTPIWIQQYGEGSTLIDVADVYMHSWTRELNGISTPSGRTRSPWNIQVRRCVFDAVGGQGNTRHTIYTHGRPYGTLIVEDSEFRGSRACSQIKADSSRVEIRRNVFKTHSALSTYTAHTMVDVASCASVVISGNQFDLWNGDPKTLPLTSQGLKTAAIYLRNRRLFYGCDRPAYPNLSWDPPASDVLTRSSPGGTWPAGSETFVNDGYWAEFRAKDRQDPAHPFTSKHYISDNIVTGSGFKPLTFIRDDGMMPSTAVTAFGASRMLRNHPQYVDPSVTFTARNTVAPGIRFADMTSSMAVNEIDEGAIWPRTAPEHFPVLFDVPLSLPGWFET